MTVRSVGSFVDALKSFEGQPITTDRVLGLCLDSDIDRSSLSPYVHWQDAFYTRNLIFRDEWFEVMAVCWQRGQKTPIHSHNGQLGWMLIIEGCAEVTNFKWRGCNFPEGQNVSGIDCVTGATQIDLERGAVEVCHRMGSVNVVHRERTIHRVATVGADRVVSLHVYSRPIDSCVAYDLETSRCWRREMKYYSVHGDVIMSEDEVRALVKKSPPSSPPPIGAA
jgi:cysteine dioxygenase